ncbi:MAG: hypothetical protein R3C69_16345 [Geminicoccaceae bacterium]
MTEPDLFATDPPKPAKRKAAAYAPLASACGHQSTARWSARTQPSAADRLGRMLAHKNGIAHPLGAAGCGKTTLARLLAQEVGQELLPLSAVMSGVAELRKAFESAPAGRCRPPPVALHRRDPPLQPGPAGRAAARRSRPAR